MAVDGLMEYFDVVEDFGRSEKCRYLVIDTRGGEKTFFAPFKHTDLMEYVGDDGKHRWKIGVPDWLVRKAGLA